MASSATTAWRAPILLAAAAVFALGAVFGAGVAGAAARVERAPALRRGLAPALKYEEPPGRAVARAALAVSALIRGNGIYGAGVLIGPEHILTCLHVVDRMSAIELSIADGPAESAEIVERDKELDLAVLRVEHRKSSYARLVSATQARMGDPVFAMGAPRNMTFSLTSGIVSYVGRDYSDIFYLQTDVPTNSGSSGGPVLDERGRVIAISTFILRDSQGLAFALPIDYAYRRFGRYFSDRLSSDGFAEWLAAHAAQRKSEPERRSTHGFGARARVGL